MAVNKFVYLCVSEMLSNAVNHLCRQCRHQFISVPMRCSRAVVPRPLQANVQLHSWLLNTPVRFKGHSHWQNVKSTKTAKDDQRQKITNRVIQRIRLAVRGWCSHTDFIFIRVPFTTQNESIGYFLFLCLKEVDTRCCGCTIKVIYVPVGVFYVFCITCLSPTTLITIPLGTPQTISFIPLLPQDSREGEAAHMQVFSMESAFPQLAFQREIICSMDSGHILQNVPLQCLILKKYSTAGPCHLFGI